MPDSRLRRWAILLAFALGITSASCKRGTAQPERLAEVDGEVFDAAADATHVYFLVWRSPRAIVARMAIGGASLETLAEDDESPRHIALTADTIYWTTESNLKRVPKSGGKPALFAARVDGRIVVDGRDLYSFERKPSGLARLVARSLQGTGSPVRVVAEEAHGTFISVDDEAVYTAPAIGGGDLERIPKAGGASATVLAKPRVGGPLLLAGDDVYYCDGALHRVSKKGGEARKVSATCGERLASVDGVIYASAESSATGFGGHQDGRVTRLSPTGQSLFEGSSARGLVAAGGALYVAGHSEAHPRVTWLRLRAGK
jgi:hypothetical protein